MMLLISGIELVYLMVSQRLACKLALITTLLFTAPLAAQTYGDLPSETQLKRIQAPNLDDKSGLFIDLGNSMRRRATMNNPEPLFAYDDPNAIAIFSPGDVQLEIVDIGTSEFQFSTIGSSIQGMPGTQRTYQNADFISIQFIENSTGKRQSKDGWRRFLVQAIHRSSGKTYFFAAFGRVPSLPFPLKGISHPPFEMRIYAINGKVPRNLVHLVRTGFDAMMTRFEKTMVPVTETRLFGSGADSGPIVRFLPKAGRADFQQRMTDFNAAIKASPGYVFDGNSRTLLNLIKDQIAPTLISPICNHFMAGVSPLIAAGGATIDTSNGSCHLRSFLGELAIELTTTSAQDCIPGSCTLGVGLDCWSRGAPLLEACVNFKADIYSKYGTTAVRTLHIAFDKRGNVQAVDLKRSYN